MKDIGQMLHEQALEQEVKKKVKKRKLRKKRSFPTSATAQEGREMVARGFYDEFLEWSRKNLPWLDPKRIERLFSDPLVWHDKTVALNLYDSLIRSYPVEDPRDKNLWDHLRHNKDAV